MQIIMDFWALKLFYFKRFFVQLIVFNMLIFSTVAKASDTVQDFPLQNYTQNINYFFDPQDKNYNTPLISDDIIKERVANYKEHLYGELSPWSENFVTKILTSTAPNDIQTIEMNLLQGYRKGCDTTGAISFAENFKSYSCDWFDNKILNNMNLAQFISPMNYEKNNRAIATDNIEGRSFPTNEPLYFSFKLAGQGYPFDNLQVSSLWAGSSLYVLGQTKDKLWSLILTESGFITWAPSKKIALMSDNLISEYTWHVNTYGLRAITHTETNIKNIENETSFFTAYIGSIFPVNNNDSNKIIIPIRKLNGYAKLVLAMVDNNNSVIFPMLPTTKNFASILSELQNRPYGWGGMYFYNDCSQETQSIFAVFGIWLPRNSADQPNVGKVEDLSGNATTDMRLKNLSSDAHKLVTLVYIKGHIMLYIGNYNYFGNSVPTVYNNLWGMRPADSSYRSIIGQAAFFPLFASNLYPEDKNLISLADKQYRPVFILSFLDQLPSNTPTGLFKSSDDFSDRVDIRKMIIPENLFDSD